MHKAISEIVIAIGGSSRRRRSRNPSVEAVVEADRSGAVVAMSVVSRSPLLKASGVRAHVVVRHTTRPRGCAWRVIDGGSAKANAGVTSVLHGLQRWGYTWVVWITLARAPLRFCRVTNQIRIAYHAAGIIVFCFPSSDMGAIAIGKRPSPSVCVVPHLKL